MPRQTLVLNTEFSCFSNVTEMLILKHNLATDIQKIQFKINSFMKISLLSLAIITE